MRRNDPLKADDVNAAAWEATRGAVVGAAKYGLGAAALGGVGYLASPLYRGLTIQFKLYLQISVMAIGSMIEADYRLRQYESGVRMQRRMMKERARWERYEREHGGKGDGDD